jgi:MFS family permease
MDRRSRRWTLIAGWLVALPVPVVIWLAPSWSWIVAANALLGINQGFAWSATVVMKIDLAGPHRRGLATGLNEFAGYLAVAIAAFASGVIAARFGLRAGPVYLGFGLAIAGLVASVFLVRDTTAHARLEATHVDRRSRGNDVPAIRRILARSLWSDASLFSASQAGFVNNLNDGLAWGLFPLFFIGAGVSLEATAALAATYPGVWGMSQILTGGLSDRFGRRPLIVAGMVVQGMALLSIAIWHGTGAWTAALAALGAGTALVYPTLLAAVADRAGASARAPAVAVYRLWRDLGYVAGALLAGAVADAIGIPAAIATVGALTIASGTVVALRMARHPVPDRE